MDAVMLWALVAGVAAVVAIAGAWSSWRAVSMLRDVLRQVARDRDYLNRTLTYESGRTLR